MRTWLSKIAILCLCLFLLIASQIALLAAIQAISGGATPAIIFVARYQNLADLSILPMLLLLPIAFSCVKGLRQPQAPLRRAWQAGVVLLEAILFVLASLGFQKPMLAAKVVSQQLSCMQNMKNLSSALLLYSQDWDETLPPAQRWSDATITYLMRDPSPSIKSMSSNGEASEFFHCPAAKTPYSYAFNRELDRFPLSRLQNPTNVVCLFESDAARRNAVGNSDALPRQPRHIDSFVYGFADGHVKRMSANQARQRGVRWHK